MAQTDPPARETASTPGVDPARLRTRRRSGLLLVVLGGALFGLLLYRIAGPRPVPPPQVVRYTPQQTADAQKDLDALRTQLFAPPPAPAASMQPPPRVRSQGAVAAAAVPQPSPSPAPVRLQLSQADLNTYLATDPHVKALLAARGVKAVQLFLHAPHNVTCRASVSYKGRPTNVQIVGNLLPSPDTLARFEATSAQVGTLPLPPSVVTSQANRVAAQFSGRMHGRFPITVQKIQVVGDRLFLIGVRRTPVKR